MNYTTPQKLIILLSSLKEMTPARLDKLLSIYQDPADIFRQADAPDFPFPALSGIIKAQNKESLGKCIDKLERNNITVLFRDDSPCLNFESAPPLLYVKGDSDLLNEGGVAIIGSRKCSRYGSEVAKSLGKAAAQNGITVISGGAQGIDSVALNSALESGGKAIAVLGFGMDKIYPAENKALFAKIEQNGTLVSEYPLGTPAYPSHFPMRNRIISGLCDLLAVVEASIKSGTSSTVMWAQEQCKEIACVPGNITSEQSQGTNMLIRDGARMLTCVEDMLEFFGKSTSKKIKKTVVLTPEEREIVQAFAVEEELSLDELAQKCNNSPGALAAQVTLMELNGILVRSQGSLYCLNKDNDYK